MVEGKVSDESNFSCEFQDFLHRPLLNYVAGHALPIGTPEIANSVLAAIDFVVYHCWGLNLLTILDEAKRTNKYLAQRSACRSFPNRDVNYTLLLIITQFLHFFSPSNLQILFMQLL